MKMNREMRYKRQELYDITKRELFPFTAEGKEYQAYGNVNLSIMLTDRCNASCDFCVAELRYMHEGVEFIKPKIKDDETYYNRLEYVLEIVKPLNPSVSLTGGEPSLDRKLPRVLNILAEAGVRKRTMTTNGSGLLHNVSDGRMLMEHLIDYELEHLNISRAHYDEKKNMHLMRLRNPYFSNRALAYAIDMAKSNGIRPRLSCILSKNGVGTLDEMEKYMDFAGSMGVDNVVFRQMMAFDEEAVLPGTIPDFCKENKVELIPIWEQIDKDPSFVPINQVLGYYYYVEVYNHKGIDMVAEMADLKKIEKEKENSLKATGGVPVIYEMVFHPNGNLCGSWREWKEIISG